MHNKHIILGITGGIAAYKSAMLARLFIKAGAEVQVIMTPNARQFITPVTLSALTGRPVITEFFSANSGEWHSHVDLGLWADAMAIAPATACTIAKMATGVADNMLVTSYLSARCPVFVAPAMDLDMMSHPSTMRNLATLAADGVHIIEPAVGELASHLTGRGRMEEPEEIFKAIDKFFTAADKMPLQGKHVLITAGPTIERIDPVRYISNFSSGKMGYALAAAARRRGARVTLVTGPCHIPVPAGVDAVQVESAEQMLAAATEAFGTADIAIMAAAVADYAPEQYVDHKIKRETDAVDSIRLKKNPDIARTLGAAKRPGQIIVGFALETDHGAAHAADKLRRKNLDMIVLNSLQDKGAGFGTDTNKVTLFFADPALPPRQFPLKGKQEIADDILDCIEQI